MSIAYKKAKITKYSPKHNYFYPGIYKSNMPHIGVDESGKGDYFGYLVVGAVYVDEKNQIILKKIGVKDSKMIADNKIIELDKKIREMCKYEIVKISPEKYNIIYKKFKSLNKLLAWAHARAIENMLRKVKCDTAITDKFGEERFLKETLFEKSKKINIIQRTKAESDVAVAAASIIARAEFLKTLRQLGRLVGFVLPKGSAHVEPTAKQLIDKHGRDILDKVAKTHFKITKRI